MIDALVGSNSQCIVEESVSGSSYSPNGGIVSTYGQNNSFYEQVIGGVINWDPNGSPIPVQSHKNTIFNSILTADPLMSLLHESAHAF
jgi:hypothetical protein